MRGLAILAVMAALCGSASADDCRLIRRAALDVKLDAAGGPMIPMSISGHPLFMLVDTGGIYSMLTKHRVGELKLVEHELHGIHFGSGGHQIDRYVGAKDLVLDHITGSGTQMLVMPDDLAAPDVDGTFAPDFLSLFDVELDLGHAKINLFAPETCDAIPVYWTQTAPFAQLQLHQDTWKHVTLDVELNGKPLTAEIDTGTSISFMSLETAENIVGISETDPQLQTVSKADGTVRGLRYPFQTLVFGNVVVEHPMINLTPEHHRGGADMVLGMNVLRQLHLYISYKHSKIYATAAAAQ